MEKLAKLDSFIEYLRQTDESEWQVGTVRNKDNTQNCCFGHLVNWYYGKDYEGTISDVWDFFEEVWATTYMIYPVNDGENPKYKQETPKARIIAYLEDLNSGNAKTSCELWHEHFNNSKLKHEKTTTNA